MEVFNMIINILDQSFNRVGVVDDFISVIWRPAYYDVGDFELYINATSEAVELLQPDYYLVRDKDVSVDSAGNVTYRNVMIIKNFTIETGVDEGDRFIFTGRELKFLLNKRIVWQQTTLSGKTEKAIRKLVNDNAISPSDSNRVIPHLILGAESGLADTIDKQVTGDKLDTCITEICTAYNYGWDVYIYNTNLVFIVYAGVDRSYAQTDRPYVVFSDSFDNIINSTYERRSEEYANCTLIAGEGEGVARITTTVNNTLSGLERTEIFTDARDLSRNEGSEDEIDSTTYLKLLVERGRENIAALEVTEGFSGEVETVGSFTYGIDFDLGDIVTVINRYGITKNVKVLSAIESVDDTGSKLIPQFNI
jgi:hypothetical protein